MMKLRYLFNNFALAEMLLKNWDYDQTSLHLLQDFRISANAIYPFRQNGELCFLRCSPCSEKLKEHLISELDFINYLRTTGYQALEPLLGKTGAQWLQKSTPWGDYYACAFKRVQGQAICETDLDDPLILSYGRALGQLHALSATYAAPNPKHWTHTEVFDWIAGELKLLPPDPKARYELNMLREFFFHLTLTPANYGLVHYDFETDNVFYDPSSGLCSVIDFDDAMYHWYVMDIVQALDSLKQQVAGEAFAHLKAVFLSGYSSQFAIDDDLLAATPILRRFASLYRYTRTKRSIQEHWDNEPAWMVDLRLKLEKMLKTDAASFGKPLYL
jgi:Ser/Thr protein kinase RdoA (MazF antagonist)